MTDDKKVIDDFIKKNGLEGGIEAFFDCTGAGSTGVSTPGGGPEYPDKSRIPGATTPGATTPGATTPGYIDDKNTSYDIVGSSGTGGLIGASGTGGHINFTATSGSAGLTDSYDTSNPLMREYLVEKGFYKNK